MASYSLRIKPSAKKEIEAISPRRDRVRIVATILDLKEHPRPTGARKLSGNDKYRIRVGRYRILYLIRDDLLIINVVKVAQLWLSAVHVRR